MSAFRAGIVPCALALALAAGAEAASPATVPPATVSVTLTNRTITFGSPTVQTGTVTFEIRNKSKVRRSFSIQGHSASIKIAAGKSGVLKLTFDSAGSFSYLSTAQAHGRQLRGVLTVVEPCLRPAATTVSVQLGQSNGGLSVSQTSIPCGAVTFVVSDTGTLTDSLHIFGDGPGPHASTPELSSGQTVSVTVQFLTKGLAHIESGDYPPEEPEFGGDYGEEAQLTID